jgi:hypothetical protein
MLELSCRMELHTAKCCRCGNGVSTQGHEICTTCELENVTIGMLGGVSAEQKFREIDALRNERRKENGF